ncbi:MAG: hydantoinase B/oxoprolinase family protein [Bacteroidota bacterium]
MSIWQISIDTGGTFTDCIAYAPSGEKIRRKVLSNSTLRGEIIAVFPGNRFTIQTQWEVEHDLFKGYDLQLLDHDFSAKVMAFDPALSEIELDTPLPTKMDLPATFAITAHEEAPVLAARLVTETPLDRQFPPVLMRLGTTKGTNALLEGKGAKTAFLVTRGFKDLLEIGTQQRPDIFAKKIIKRKPLYSSVVEIEERLDSDGNPIIHLTPDDLQNEIEILKAEAYESIAVALMHSYLNQGHEQKVSAYLAKQGFGSVSTSSELAPRIKLLPRAETAVVNAYLEPVMNAYISNVRKMVNGQLLIMTSAGGLLPADAFRPKDSLLSGPAGGVVGAAMVAENAGFTKVISFDMGGTSTDVARYDGSFDYRYEQVVGDAHLFAPALHIETVAAGGGSICSFDGHNLKVGPESAGAFPGPACYGAGGPLTLTDVHLLLGRLDSSLFSIPVYPEKAKDRLKEIFELVKVSRGGTLDETDLLNGFLEISNEIMAGAIRKISVSKGYDPKDHCMMAFGGAGGLQACSLAERLGIKTVLISSDGGLLSAKGIGDARVKRFAEQQILETFDQAIHSIKDRFDLISKNATDLLANSQYDDSEIEITAKLIFLRFKGQDASLDVPYRSDQKLILSLFKDKYEQQFGHWPQKGTIEVESIRVIAAAGKPKQPDTYDSAVVYTPTPTKSSSSYFKGEWSDTWVFNFNDLQPGALVSGPCIMIDPFSTTVIESGWSLKMLGNRTARIDHVQQAEQKEEHQIAHLELFTNRFMAIAEDMGAMLQRTALSVNVKERLDFSCALIDPGGQLIANAPHIPVHLGSLGVCVRKLKDHISMMPGDVIVTNHPKYGGSHLPDITLVMPVFTDDDILIGYVVNRAHHSEIGGSRPGSMPPNAKSLAEEGVVIEPFHFIKNGKVNWEELESLLRNNQFPSRSVEENMADLNAALAANLHGANALNILAKQHGHETILHYMTAIKQNAAEKMRAKLKTLPDGDFLATEYLDDGTPLAVKTTLKSDTCTIDFRGSGTVHPGNLNANEAIVNSVVVYVLRLLLDEDLPLNEGLLEPIDIILPKGILNPDFPDNHSECPAVVGGNTETSQRLTGLLLKAFKLIAGSQGTMNNVLFGNEHFGYYETIGGGGGAGEGFNGASAVHHHMTNTRITDPEIMEHRYPVRLWEFAVRQNSGGDGKWPGGNGIIRKIEFLEKIKLSVLTQHRTQGPYGMNGGNQGKPGQQFIIKANGSQENLASVDQADLEAGDQLVIETPGGGGFGFRED